MLEFVYCGHVTPENWPPEQLMELMVLADRSVVTGGGRREGGVGESWRLDTGVRFGFLLVIGACCDVAALFGVMLFNSLTPPPSDSYLIHICPNLIWYYPCFTGPVCLQFSGPCLNRSRAMCVCCLYAASHLTNFQSCV